MRIIKTLLAASAVIVTASVAMPVQADGHLGKAVKARQAQMQLYAWNLGTLGAMAKGEKPYDAAAAKAAAENLAALTAMSQQGMWPKGTDSAEMFGDTRAKPEIWSTYPKIVEAGDATAAASAELAKVAGNGLEALQAGIGNVGKTCGGCHKPFREPK